MPAQNGAAQATHLVLGDTDMLTYCARFLDCAGLGLLCRTCSAVRAVARIVGMDLWLEFAEHANTAFLMQALRRAVCSHNDEHAWLLFVCLHIRCVQITGSDAFFLGLLRYPLDEPRPLLASAVLAKNYAWTNAFAVLMHDTHADAAQLCRRERALRAAATAECEQHRVEKRQGFSGH